MSVFSLVQVLHLLTGVIVGLLNVSHIEIRFR